MPRYKPQERHSLLLPVVLSEQIIPGSFAFALDYLVDHELDLSAMDAKFKNDEVGASAYDPRVMLKLVLLAYSQGMISSRAIECACARNIQFIAISGDSQPSHAHVAKFVSHLGDQIKPLFAQVLMTCDAQGLIGREMFAIDGVKLPSNASKERSGSFEELRHRAERLEKAADKIVDLHQAQDNATQEQPLEAKRQARIEALRKEAQRTREFLASNSPRLNRKGQELKTNITDSDSAKMATSKGVIQGYAAQAAVDNAHQIIVAADVIGSGSEQAMLLPLIKQTGAYRQPHTLITADAGYHSDANMAELMRQVVPALIADNQMRNRDERFADQGRHKPQHDVLYDKRPTGLRKTIAIYAASDFTFLSDKQARCPQGKLLTGNGTVYRVKDDLRLQYKARTEDCEACQKREYCMRQPQPGKSRTVTQTTRSQSPEDNPSARMRCAIDSTRGRAMYSQRIGTVEPVFGNIRHNKRLNRLNLRGKDKVNAQWHLFCMVHNIEKLANSGWRQ